MNTRWNHRSHLVNGIRRRIANEPYGFRLIWLYSMLFDAVELPA